MTCIMAGFHSFAVGGAMTCRGGGRAVHLPGFSSRYALDTAVSPHRHVDDLRFLLMGAAASVGALASHRHAVLLIGKPAVASAWTMASARPAASEFRSGTAGDPASPAEFFRVISNHHRLVERRTAASPSRWSRSASACHDDLARSRVG